MAKTFTTACACGATEGQYPTNWAGMWKNGMSQNGCSECRNDIRALLGLPMLANPAMVLLSDRLAGSGAGSQLRLTI